MGSFAPKGHARVDPQHPAAFAMCDMCGFQYNHRDLRWEMQWRGNKIEKTGFLVCPTCWDEPNPTLRPKVLPPDPVPVLNPRPGDYLIEQDICTEDLNPLETETTFHVLMTDTPFMDVP